MAWPRAALEPGFDSTTAALQSAGVTAGSGQINNAFGGFVTDGGPGANTIGLRGLGATRTLVLMNGRRISPAGTRGAVGTADVNVLPSSVIDRIEILKDGASSIYGSDAVAGVINIITRKNIHGVTFEGQYNAPEDGGGVPGARSDLEDAILGAELQRRRHEGHDVGLRDGLPLGDRQRGVLIGELGQLRGQERLARHLAHRAEHLRVRDAASRDQADQPLAVAARRTHQPRDRSTWGSAVNRPSATARTRSNDVRTPTSAPSSTTASR